MRPLRFSYWCIASAVGAGYGPLVGALENNVGGLAPCRFETVDLPTYAGEVAGLDDVRMLEGLEDYDCRNNRLALLALQQGEFSDGVAAARKKYGAGRIGVFVGTSTSGILQTELAYRRRDPDTGMLPLDFRFVQTHNTASLADFVQRSLGLTGPAMVVSSACASSAKVFGTASRMIQAGLCDAAVVGGADSLCLTTLYGFNSLQLVSTLPCRPFDSRRDGISIGEAAGFVLLEMPTGQSSEINLLGVGESSDAYHMSTPHPQGLGARLAMEKALADAGLPASAIDYVNLHGTATRAGDAAEDEALCTLLGMDVPCSSTKGYLGHTLGAAGITEAIISLACIEQGFMPGSHNTSDLEAGIRCRYLLKTEAARINTVMTNSFGFGGSNCSLVLGRAS